MSRTTTPRRKRFNQKQRLATVRSCLQSYTEDKVARAYRKYFGVDWETTFRELEMLGIQFPADYKETVLKNLVSLAETKKQKLALENPDQDERFAFIVGYTSGGAPYGLTWNEWEQSEPEMP